MTSVRVPGMALALLLSLSFLLPFSSESPVICEELPQELCTFAISTASKRCVLGIVPRWDGATAYRCRTSEAVVERMTNWVETDGCVRACEVERGAVAISSDYLLEPQFVPKLCSPACYQNSPKKGALYSHLAAEKAYDNSNTLSVAISGWESDTSDYAGIRIDWKETPEEHVFKADLPGMSKAEVQVQVEDDKFLKFSGKRSKENKEETDMWHQEERSSGKFLRRFQLPENIKAGEVKADMKDGMLTVTVPKVETKKRLVNVVISG